jgi:hypothetical protein
MLISRKNAGPRSRVVRIAEAYKISIRALTFARVALALAAISLVLSAVTLLQDGSSEQSVEETGE